MASAVAFADTAPASPRTARAPARAACNVAVIGAGPYGLAVAAHLKAAGIETLAFGEPMGFWRNNMPTGMRLRSPWRATHIADPENELSLDAYARRVGMTPMRLTWLRHTPGGYGGLMTKPIDAAQTRDWVEPCLTNASVRRDFAKLACGIDPGQLVANAERLRGFNGPVLVAWAPADRFFRIEDGVRLASCFDHARVVEIPDSGTFVAHDQPDRLASEVDSFVTSTSAGTPG